MAKFAERESADEPFWDPIEVHRELWELAVQQQQERAELQEQIAKLVGLLSNREWLTARVIKLMNSERRRLLVVFAAGATAMLLLTGGGLGAKIIYDAGHQPPPTTAAAERVEIRTVPIYARVESQSGQPGPIVRSPTQTPTPGEQPPAPPDSPLPPLPEDQDQDQDQN